MCPTTSPNPTIIASTSTSTSTALHSSFLGNPVEICLVTKDFRRAIAALSALGIGPWRIYTFSPSNTINQTYRSKPTPFTLRVCFAELSPTMVYEVIQPVSGPTIFQEFLDQHGEGIHHVAYDCNHIPFEDRIKGFEERGFEMSQGGSWMGRSHFVFFQTEERTGTCFETYAFPEDWDYPEPDEWLPVTVAGAGPGPGPGPGPEVFLFSGSGSGSGVLQ